MALIDPRKQAQQRLYLWRATRATENSYARKLRMIAANVAGFIHQQMNDVWGVKYLEEAIHRTSTTLTKYSEVLDHWANSAAEEMVREVAARNRNVWLQEAHDAGVELRNQIQFAPIESTVRELVHAQVGLIKSLPLEAAQRVQELAIAELSEGRRIEHIVQEILNVGGVTKSRAELIAFTECGRASTSLTQARAEATGNSHYTWRSMHDGNVRHRHRELDGTVHEWANPPLASEPGQREMYYHPGCGPRCRCIAIPIITNF
jgi:SPP1 gp7 family putative phage head morphogenesis protein